MLNFVRMYILPNHEVKSFRELVIEITRKKRKTTNPLVCSVSCVTKHNELCIEKLNRWIDIDCGRV